MGQQNKTSYFKAYKGDDFLFAMAEFEEFLKKLKPEEDVLRTPKYSSSDLKISRRVLSHWRKLGLLDESDTTKLSLVECFWIAIVDELRSFGYPLDKIKKVKDEIFNPKKIQLLVFFVYQVFKKDNQTDYFLIVNSKGESDIGSINQIMLMEDFGLIKDNYIKINFNLVRNKLTKTKLPTLKEDFKYKLMSDEEKKIIDAVRSGKYKKIAIRFKDGTVTHLEKESVVKVDVMAALTKAVSEQSFGNITLTQKDGKIIHMQNIATEKL